MKIAVLSDDSVTVAQHGGRANGCMLFDVDDLTRPGEFVPLPESHCEDSPVGQPHTHEGALGHNHDHILELVSGCQVVISRGMGQRLRNDLSARGVRAITTDEIEIRRVVRMFSAGTLIPSPEANCGRH